MRILEGVIQGSKEWLEHRRAYFTASEAPAALGLSKYKTRSQLLHEQATGITPEINAPTQRRFDKGHESEAATRVIAEKIVGEELFPATGIETVDGLPLLASFDGITMLETALWENKLWNEDFAAQVKAGEVPDTHWPQLEHQMLVAGLDKVLFTVSDGDIVEHIWYSSQPARRARVIAAWKQFAADLAAYVPPEVIEKPKADAIMALPALSVQATGMVTYSNLPEFKAAAESYIASINTDLQTDQHFADAEATVKFCKSTEEKLEVTKSAILAQTASIDEVIRTVDHIQAQLREKRLMLDKLVTKEKEARKADIVRQAGIAFSAHVEALESETRPIQLNVVRPDFAGAIKGKKLLSAMQEAVDTALRNGKFDADTIAKDIRAKLAWCKETSSGFGFLFNDLQQIITKPTDDFKLVVTTRIEAHKAAEAKKEEDLRAKVQAEEAAKLEAERARMQAEEEAKARAKVEAEERAKAEAELASKPVYGAEQAQIEAIGGYVAAIDTSPKYVEKVAEVRHIKPTRPSDDQIIAVLSEHYRVHESKVIEWLLDIDLNAASERMAKEFA